MAAPETWVCIAGHPALDFTNTVGWHAGANPIDRLHTYEGLIDWLRDNHMLDPREHDAHLRRSRRSPAAARHALRRAIAIRELIYRTCAAIAHHRAPARADLARLHAEHVNALSHGTLDWSDGFAVSFARSRDLLAPVYPLLLSAMDLLRSPDLIRMRQCANDPCGWLFLDRSKNHSRRWCASWDCGNETRVKRFRDKARARANGGS